MKIVGLSGAVNRRELAGLLMVAIQIDDNLSR